MDGVEYVYVQCVSSKVNPLCNRNHACTVNPEIFKPKDEFIHSILNSL